MTVVASWVNKEFTAMMDEISNNVFTRMDVLHHLLAGFKAIFSN